MSFNIVDLVRDQLSDQLMGGLSNALGMQSTQTSTALSGALPGILSGLLASASSPSGADALFESVGKQDDDLLANMGNLLGGSDPSAIANQGSSVLTSLLGDGALGKLAGVVSSFAGIDQRNSGSLMGLLAPIVIGVIKKKVLGDGLNAGALAQMFSGQKDNINAAMPQAFSNQLQSSGFLDSIKNAQPMAFDSAPATPSLDVEPQPISSGGGLMKWLLPLVAVLVLGWLGIQFLGGNKAEDAIGATQDAVSGAAGQATAMSTDALQNIMPDGIDFGEITNSLDGVFSSTTESLSGITDLDSARDALPSIEDATGKLGGLSDIIGGLPDAAKGPLAAIVQTGLSALQPIVEKVSAIPGVGDIIEPVVGPLMTMLEGLAG